MGSERSIEMTGDSIEDAIAKGLAQLGVGPAEVIVEVLEEPSAAMFGMEARPARVRLQLMVVRPPDARVTPSPEPNEALTVAPVSRPAPQRSDRPERAERPVREQRLSRPDRGERPSQADSAIDRPARAPRGERGGRPQGERRPPRSDRPDRRREPVAPDALEPELDDALPFVQEAEEIPEAEVPEDATVARVVLNAMLEKLDIRSRIAVRRSTPDEQTGAAPFILDIMSSGNSNRLIGRRGDTLASLQYLTRLITSREVQHRVDVIVDVNSYKARRAQALTALALRMAAEAVEQKRTVTLEPMPPHERRIVHLALRGREDVSTRSVGEGTARKVTIVPTQPEAQ